MGLLLLAMTLAFEPVASWLQNTLTSAHPTNSTTVVGTRRTSEISRRRATSIPIPITQSPTMTEPAGLHPWPIATLAARSAMVRDCCPIPPSVERTMKPSIRGSRT